jgi:hypothetical protein
VDARPVPYKLALIKGKYNYHTAMFSYTIKVDIKLYLLIRLLILAQLFTNIAVFIIVIRNPVSSPPANRRFWIHEQTVYGNKIIYIVFRESKSISTKYAERRDSTSKSHAVT